MLWCACAHTTSKPAAVADATGNPEKHRNTERQNRVTRTTTAPNFRGDYPGAGERIGPAWQAAWDELCSGREIRGDQLTAAMLDTVDIKSHTAESLLRQARQYGVLNVRYRRVDSRRRAFYSRGPLGDEGTPE